MAHTLTTELSLVKPTSGTHEPYSITNENANWDRLDGQFNFGAGHAHAGPHQGAQITSAGIVSGVTLTSPHFTTATVDSGGLTVTAGNVGIGITAQSSDGLVVDPGNITSAVNATGIRIGGGVCTLTASSPYTAAGLLIDGNISLIAGSNNASLAGLYIAPTYNANAKTSVTASGITIAAVTGSSANNYGIFINAPSGASGVNEALHVEGNFTQANGSWKLSGGSGSFFGAALANRQTLSGSRSGGAALVSVIAALVNLGLATDSTTA